MFISNLLNIAFISYRRSKRFVFLNLFFYKVNEIKLCPTINSVSYNKSILHRNID